MGTVIVPTSQAAAGLGMGSTWEMPGIPQGSRSREPFSAASVPPVPADLPLQSPVVSHHQPDLRSGFAEQDGKQVTSFVCVLLGVTNVLSF